MKPYQQILYSNSDKPGWRIQIFLVQAAREEEAIASHLAANLPALAIAIRLEKHLFKNCISSPCLEISPTEGTFWTLNRHDFPLVPQSSSANPDWNHCHITDDSITPYPFSFHLKIP
jgi:hypothetical protein